MNKPVSKSWLDCLSDFFSKRPVYHSLVWLLYIVLLFSVTNETRGGLFFTFTNILIRVFFFGVVVYFNLLYLIPNFLAKKRFLSYLFYLVLSVAVVTPIEIMLLHVKMQDFPEAQQRLLDSQFDHFVFAFFIVLLSTVAKIIKDWFKQQRIQKDLERQNMQSELRFLRSQINPHFLFNTLNNLYALTLKKSDQAPEIVLRLAEMMRYMLYECNEKRVPLSKELNYIRNYLELERQRHGNDIEISFEWIGGEVGRHRVAPLLFIPFLENSFKHGISRQIDSGYVRLAMGIQEEQVHFRIENSKPEQRDTNYHQGGIGLTNSRRRLAILYPKHHKLIIQDQPHSYLVQLQIDLDR